MNKTLFLLPVAMTTILSLSAFDVSASTNNSINLYNVKKVNNKYKVTKTSKIIDSKVKSFGNEHKYNGKTYYYVTNLRKYTDQTGYKLVNKYYNQKAIKQSDTFDQAVKNNESNHKKNDTVKSDTPTAPKVVDGYDENNQKIVDVNTFTNVLTQTAFNRLNAFRQSLGLSTLSLDSDLTKVAQVRAQQVESQPWNATTDETHLTSDGTRRSLLVAQQLGLQNYQDGSENAAELDMSGLDHTIDMGNAAIQNEINEGPGSDYNLHGHYINDVDPNITKVGIGFYVDQSKGYVGFAMELN